MWACSYAAAPPPSMAERISTTTRSPSRQWVFSHAVDTSGVTLSPQAEPTIKAASAETAANWLRRRTNLSIGVTGPWRGDDTSNRHLASRARLDQGASAPPPGGGGTQGKSPARPRYRLE